MNNREVQIARDYHDGTKHPGGRLLNPSHRYGPHQRPGLFKIYPDLQPIPLPQENGPPNEPRVTALQAIVGGDGPASGDADLDLPSLARLLHYSAGITKHIHNLPFRAAACTGALYHIELYLVNGDLPGLEAGVYHYDPGNSALRRLRQGDYRQVLIESCAQEQDLRRAPAALIYTDVFKRNAVKYQAREYRHAFWDSGTILANSFALCTSLGLPASLVLGFVDQGIVRLLGLDPDEELPLAVVPIGRGAGTALPDPPPVTELDLAVEPYARYLPDFPAVRAMHAASSLPDAQSVTEWRNQSFPLTLPKIEGRLTGLSPLAPGELPDESIETVIRRRGSTRRFSHAPIRFAQLSTALARAVRGLEADYGDARTRLTTAYLIANAVDGLAPGAYVYHPDRKTLELLRGGEFRREAGYLALGQPLGADASAAIFFLTDLDKVLATWGNRGYRAAQLEASVTAGRLYLAAYALGFGATGLTFFDDAVTDFFSPHAQGKRAMFLIALGRKG